MGTTCASHVLLINFIRIKLTIQECIHLEEEVISIVTTE